MWKYCTKGDVAGFSGLNEEKIDDAWSEMVEDLIDEYTGTTYAGASTYTESYDGDGTDTIHLEHTPISSVTSVSVDGVALQSSEYKVYESGFIRLVSSTGSAIDAAVGSVGSTFPVGQQNVTVVYVGGYANVPGRVRFAATICISEIALVAERGGADSSFAVSRATQRAGESDRSFVRSVDITGKVRTIIQNTIGQRWRFK